jgi:serine/threonine-protein phosphatase 2A activator
MLDQLDAWIDDIPLDTGVQRFGNKAFRKWGERLEQVCLRPLDELEVLLLSRSLAEIRKLA